MKIIKAKKGRGNRYLICGGKDGGKPCIRERKFIPIKDGVLITSCECGSAGVLLSLTAMEYMRAKIAESNKKGTYDIC